jgi:chromosome segregation ATPase
MLHSVCESITNIYQKHTDEMTEDTKSLDDSADVLIAALVQEAYVNMSPIIALNEHRVSALATSEKKLVETRAELQNTLRQLTEMETAMEKERSDNKTNMNELKADIDQVARLKNEDKDLELTIERELVEKSAELQNTLRQLTEMETVLEKERSDNMNELKADIDRLARLKNEYKDLQLTIEDE